MTKHVLYRCASLCALSIALGGCSRPPEPVRRSAPLPPGLSPQQQKMLRQMPPEVRERLASKLPGNQAR